MKLKKLTIALTLGLSLPALAQAIEVWRLEDDDIEFVLTSNRSKAQPGFGPFIIGGTNYYIKNFTVAGTTVEDGDLFIAVFEFGNATRAPWPATSPTSSLIGPDQELTGILAAQATTAPGGLSFQPFGSGLNAILAAAGIPDVPGGDMGGATGALGAMWLNSTLADADPIAPDDLDLNRSSNVATNCAGLIECMQAAWDNGTLFQVDGFMGDPDERWEYSGSTDLNEVKEGGDSTLFGGYNFALSTFFNIVDPVLPQNGSGVPGVAGGCGPVGVADGCVQVRGSGTLLGGASLENGAVAHSDNDVTKYVPEPATLALFGIGLLGLGSRARRHVEA